MKNFEHCAYTYRHRVAFKYVVNKIVKDETIKEALLKRAEIHDMDKMVNYLKMSKKEASKLHRETSAHHIETGIDNKSDIDLYEMLIDFECAGYTKPDKPLNAFDWVNILYTKGKISMQQYERFVSLMENLGINSSYSVTDDKIGMDIINKCIPTEKDIMNSLMKYVGKR